MTCTREIIKMLCLKFIGKIGRRLVADLVYIIVHHLKLIFWTLLIVCLFLHSELELGKSKEFNGQRVKAQIKKTLGSILILVTKKAIKM